jgi:TonB-linked SusC/RagA family outer membrane protein
MKHTLLFCAHAQKLTLSYAHRPLLRKLIYIMKLTSILMLITCLHVSASVFSQKVTIKVQNSNLENVFKIIRQQTGYNFLYNNEDLSKSATISISRAGELKEILHDILSPKGLSFSILDNTILVKKTAVSKQVIKPQQLEIRGTIIDEKRQPLPGASIKVKGSSIATVADQNGRFNLKNLKANDILVVSYTGYQTQEVKLNGKNQVTIVLQEQAAKLDEVVVIGYGTVNRKDITGSIGQVKMEDLEKAPVMSFDQALAGRIAGVQVSSNDGQPGSSGMNIVIRGAGSLTQSTSPLYVIDDFPMENFNASSLNINDIESISVLKDASATAIFGARGSNGVVVIETKKGKIGEPLISYSGSFGYQEVAKQVKMMSPYEFVRYQLESNNNSVLMQSMYTPRDLPEDNAFYKANGKTLADYKNIKGVNWQDLIFRDGTTAIHELSVRGGNLQTRYSLSGSIYKQNGVVINSGTDRVTGRIAIDQTLTKKLKTGVIANYSNQPSFGKLVSGTATHGYNYLMYSAWGYRPVSGNEGSSGIDEELINGNTDPESEENNYLINPVTNLQNEDRLSRGINLTTNAYLDYQITKHLNLRTTGAYMAYEVESTGFYNSLTNRGTPQNPNNRGVQGDVGLNRTNMWKSSTFLTYKNQFNKIHQVNVMAGADFYESASKRYGFSSQYVPEESLGLSGMDDGVPSSNQVTLSKNRINSFFGRANYDYKSKYLFTATFRADGSSKFEAENRWGYFPSAAFAWRMSKEGFMKNLSFVSDAKLRFSYGLTGNNRVTDFAYLPTITGSNIGDAYSYDNAQPAKGYYPGSAGNSKLKWETTRQIDIGYDISLFNNRLDMVFDVYRKNTTDLLLFANTPSHTGFKRGYQNVGELQNDGLEISINTTNIKTKNFSWLSGFNISFNRNKIVALTSDESSMYSLMTWDVIHNGSYLYAARVGEQAAQFLGYVFDGVYQIDDFTWQNNSDPSIAHPSRQYLLNKQLPDNGGSTRAAVQPGDIKYVDINKDGTINEYDETVIGNPMPLHTGGFTNNLTYKNFNLNVFFQWSYGNELFNANRIYFEGGRPVNSRNQYATYTERWSPENPSNTYFRAGGQGPVGRYSSQYIEDGSYLRLKTVSLTYNLPKTFLNRFKIKNLSLNATAQNLITWTNYSGMDPEVSIFNSVLTPGFDWSAYPQARTIVFGIKATL